MSSIEGKKTSDKIDCLWGLVCSLSSVDQQRNNISVFNVIDQLNIPKNNILQHEIKSNDFNISLEHEIVFVWRRLLSQEMCDNKVVTDVKISSISPTGEKLGEILTQLVFEPKMRILRFRVQNNAFKIKGQGDYVYRIEIIQPGTTEFTFATEVPYNVRFV